jgi:hypothetical protein
VPGRALPCARRGAQIADAFHLRRSRSHDTAFCLSQRSVTVQVVHSPGAEALAIEATRRSAASLTTIVISSLAAAWRWGGSLRPPRRPHRPGAHNGPIPQLPRAAHARIRAPDRRLRSLPPRQSSPGLRALCAGRTRTAGIPVAWRALRLCRRPGRDVLRVDRIFGALPGAHSLPTRADPRPAARPGPARPCRALARRWEHRPAPDTARDSDGAWPEGQGTAGGWPRSARWPMASTLCRKCGSSRWQE